MDYLRTYAQRASVVRIHDCLRLVLYIKDGEWVRSAEGSSHCAITTHRDHTLEYGQENKWWKSSILLYALFHVFQFWDFWCSVSWNYIRLKAVDSLVQKYQKLKFWNLIWVIIFKSRHPIIHKMELKKIWILIVSRKKSIGVWKNLV